MASDSFSGESESASVPSSLPEVRMATEQIVEFVSDSGEGAQTAGQLFGTVCAKMGNGVWTTEIIPAEIEPPRRSRQGASGCRIRFGTQPVRSMGEAADLVVALNEQVIYSRIDVGALREGTILLLERAWGSSPEPETRAQYAEALGFFRAQGYLVHEIPMEEECEKIVPDPRRGKNIWCLGMLCAVYERDMDLVRRELEGKLQRRGAEVVATNLRLLEAGYAWASEHLPLRVRVPAVPPRQPMVVMNGNQAVALGVMAAGIEVCAMYPITPATTVSHYLAEAFHRVGGFVHQAEDEIAAINFALGASYAGKTPVTVTSGPGLALKTEGIGLAVMAELPVVIVDVQRGAPATGLPTRVEQGDLLAAVCGEPGDAPKIVIAPSTIEECFHFMILARRLAEMFRTPVIVLSDATLATAQQPFPRPEVREDWLAPPVDASDWDPSVPPYAWDPETGLSQRPVPGQRHGMYVLTGLAHDEYSHVAYESAINQRAMAMRSRKLATLERSLSPPKVYGDEEGDLLLVCWGSTRGAVEEAVDRLRGEGHRVGAVTLRFLSPLEPGLKAIFGRFRHVMTVELNYSDDLGDPGVDAETRRYAQLATLLRAKTLRDIDCWSRVPGVPLSPGEIARAARSRLERALHAAGKA